jgi:hypothetical protein
MTRRARLIASHLCTRCGNPLPSDDFRLECGTCREKKRTLNKNRKRRSSPSTSPAYKKVWSKTRKDLVYQAYGGYVCRCCGETEPAFLSIDHINNDGAKHRKEISKSRSNSTLISWLIKKQFPVGFQILCMNCQFGKKINNGVCPHSLSA